MPFTSTSPSSPRYSHTNPCKIGTRRHIQDNPALKTIESGAFTGSDIHSL